MNGTAVTRRTAGIFWSVLAAVSGAAVLLMLATVVLDVALRYIAGAGFRGATDLVATWWMVPVVIFGLALAQRQDSQIRVDFVRDSLRPALRKVVDVTAGIVVVAFAGALAHAGLTQAIVQMELGEYMAVRQWPIWPVRFIIPIGFAAVVCVAAIAIIAVLRKREGE